MSSSRAALLLFLFAAAAQASYVPKANTRHEIKKYVHSAARHIAQHGPSCSEFAKPEWREGDYYIFVIGPDQRTLCHPNPAMIGRSEHDVVDANGKRVGDMIVSAARKFRGGWVDYVWPRPGSSKPVPKSTYAERVKSPDGDTYIVGSGGYGVK